MNINVNELKSKNAISFRNDFDATACRLSLNKINLLGLNLTFSPSFALSDAHRCDRYIRKPSRFMICAKIYLNAHIHEMIGCTIYLRKNLFDQSKISIPLFEWNVFYSLIAKFQYKNKNKNENSQRDFSLRDSLVETFVGVSALALDQRHTVATSNRLPRSFEMRVENATYAVQNTLIENHHHNNNNSKSNKHALSLSVDKQSSEREREREGERRLWESQKWIDVMSKKRRVTPSEKQVTFFKYPASLLNVHTIFSSGW